MFSDSHGLNCSRLLSAVCIVVMSALLVLTTILISDIINPIHAHTTNVIALTFVLPLEDKVFSRELWEMATECLVVFPDGVNVLPWMLCGTNEIGEATAEKMLTSRLVVWSQHGIYGAGKDLDETFGLIETAEKAAEIYLKIAHLPLVNTISDEQMHLLEGRFGVKAREGYLD